jgi:hypothetical protein
VRNVEGHASAAIMTNACGCLIAGARFGWLGWVTELRVEAGHWLTGTFMKIIPAVVLIITTAPCFAAPARADAITVSGGVVLDFDEYDNQANLSGTGLAFTAYPSGSSTGHRHQCWLPALWRLPVTVT